MATKMDEHPFTMKECERALDDLIAKEEEDDDDDDDEDDDDDDDDEDGRRRIKTITRILYKASQSHQSLHVDWKCRSQDLQRRYDCVLEAANENTLH